MRSVFVMFLSTCALAMTHEPLMPGPPADLIVHHAVVHTMADGDPTAEAFAIRGERFLAVGTSAEVLRWRGPSTRVLDAENRTIVPGLQDAHGHVLGLGAALRELDLRDTVSFDAIVAKVRARASETAAGQWIIGRGWDQNRWPVTDWPAPGPLDAAAPDNPVLLSRIDGHAALANRRALAAAGVTRDTRDPAGGRLIRDLGRATGVPIDMARPCREERIPDPSTRANDPGAARRRPRTAACRAHDGARRRRETGNHHAVS